jgi:signal transduction histidine kinase
MDLHDEMGSGLGSIGILAGLAADERLDDASRRRLAEQIAEAAGELGTALGDIVGSLRHDADTLDSLAWRLAERGRRLFPDGRPEFATRFPERWPSVRLSLEARRNLQLIALEALHNAARHAAARHVRLGLEPTGCGWRLWVGDDGRGLPPEARAGRTRGHGLANMRSRAEAIGASIAWNDGPEAGTVVEVTFDPGARLRRARARDAVRRAQGLA